MFCGFHVVSDMTTASKVNGKCRQLYQLHVHHQLSLETEIQYLVFHLTGTLVFFFSQLTADKRVYRKIKSVTKHKISSCRFTPYTK